MEAAAPEWRSRRAQTVPTTAMLNGDFAGQKQLFFPGHQEPDPRQQHLFADHAGWAERSPTSTRGAAGGLVQRHATSPTTSILQPNNPLNYREDLVRLDYHINDKHSIYGRWIQDHNKLVDPFGTFSGSNLPTTPTLAQPSGREFSAWRTPG